MTYDGPVEDTIPEYMITCNECGRTEYVRTWTHELAEELFVRNGWQVRRRLAYCRECEQKEYREDDRMNGYLESLARWMDDILERRRMTAKISVTFHVMKGGTSTDITLTDPAGYIDGVQFGIHSESSLAAVMNHTTYIEGRYNGRFTVLLVKDVAWAHMEGSRYGQGDRTRIQ